MTRFSKVATDRGLWAIVVVVLFVLGCSSPQSASPNELALNTTTANSPSKGLVGDCSEMSISSSAGYTLDAPSAKISADTLTVSVTPTAACQPGTFFACWPGIFETSDPPAVLINLVRRAPSGACDGAAAAIDVAIDLTDVRTKFIELSSPPETTGTVSIGLNNPTVAGGGATMPYRF